MLRNTAAAIDRAEVKYAEHDEIADLLARMDIARGSLYEEGLELNAAAVADGMSLIRKLAKKGK